MFVGARRNQIHSGSGLFRSKRRIVDPAHFRVNDAIQNTNYLTPCLVYTFEFEVNLLELNPAYPKDPKTLGERIRKARMDRGLTIKQTASLIGVNISMIVNWELKNVQPTAATFEKLKEVLEIDLAMLCRPADPVTLL